MILWEVTLEIDRSAYDKFMSWNKKHVSEIMQATDFVNAVILQPYEEDKNSKTFTIVIQYTLDKMESMDNYLRDVAPRFRQEAADLFPGQITASRKAYHIVENLK